MYGQDVEPATMSKIKATFNMFTIMAFRNLIT